MTSKTLFVGIGSPHGDDRVGWMVADELLGRAIAVRKASTPSQLLDWLDRIDRLIVCDACQPVANRQVQATGDSAPPADTSTASPPNVHCWKWPTLNVAQLRSAGSHAFGLPQVLELADKLGKLPDGVVVFGVEGTRFDAFAELSANLQANFERIVSEIAQTPHDEETAVHA